jgi:drug/metabolite transporter (DMT)-like permease
VDTKARLREQRKKNRRGAFFGLGLGVGFVLGYLSGGSAPEGLTPYWASLIVAFGLGGLCVLLYWWLADHRRKPLQEESTSQS